MFAIYSHTRLLLIVTLFWSLWSLWPLFWIQVDDCIWVSDILEFVDNGGDIGGPGSRICSDKTAKLKSGWSDGFQTLFPVIDDFSSPSVFNKKLFEIFVKELVELL